LKKRQGTYRPSRDQTQGALAVVPAVQLADYELSPSEALDRVLEAGVHWIASTDGPKVALLREALAELAEMQADRAVKRADVIAQFKMISAMMGDLGFDPAARSRLGLAEVKAASTLEKLRASRDR
jgi:hypothetical protein